MDAAVTSDEQGTPTPPRGWLRPVGAFVLDLVVAAALMLATRTQPPAPSRCAMAQKSSGS